MPTPYGRGSRKSKGEVLGRDQVIDAMRFLGYITHDEQSNLTDETFKTAASLAGKVKENIMLPVLIAQEYSKHRPKHQEGT